MPARLLLLAAAALCFASRASAHCGGLHNWTFGPPASIGKDFVRHRAASCSSWTRVNASSMVLGALPVFLSNPNTLSVSGSAEIWWYFDYNCSERATTAVTINATLTLDGQPYGGKQVNGYGFTGSCSNPGDLYRHNYTKGDDRCNLVWWRKDNSLTADNGWLFGAAPNVFISRTPPVDDAVRSIVLFPSPADSDPVCCDLVYDAPPPDTFWTLAESCSSVPSHTSYPSPIPAPEPAAQPGYGGYGYGGYYGGGSYGGSGSYGGGGSYGGSGSYGYGNYGFSRRLL